MIGAFCFSASDLLLPPKRSEAFLFSSVSEPPATSRRARVSRAPTRQTARNKETPCPSIRIRLRHFHFPLATLALALTTKHFPAARLRARNLRCRALPALPIAAPRYAGRRSSAQIRR